MAKTLRLRASAVYFFWKINSPSLAETFIRSPGLKSPSSRRIESGLRIRSLLPIRHDCTLTCDCRSA